MVSLALLFVMAVLTFIEPSNWLNLLRVSGMALGFIFSNLIRPLISSLTDKDPRIVLLILLTLVFGVQATALLMSHASLNYWEIRMATWVLSLLPLGILMVRLFTQPTQQSIQKWTMEKWHATETIPIVYAPLVIETENVVLNWVLIIAPSFTAILFLYLITFNRQITQYY